MPIVSEPLQKACRDAVAIYEDLLSPCRPSDFGQWLATLGVLCAGNMTADDAKTKIAAYRGLLHPVKGVLTQATLDKAGRTFKWFPTYGEIADLLAGEERELRNQLARAKQIRDWKPAEVKREEHRPVTPEEVDAILAKHGWRKREDRSGQLESAQQVQPKPIRPARNNLPEGPGARAARLERDKETFPLSTTGADVNG